MGTEHGEKYPRLQPSYIQFPVAKIRRSLVILTLPEPFRRGVRVAAAAPVLPFAAHRKKGSDIQRPVRIPGQPHVQALHDLLFQRFPGGAGVARPQHRPVFLPRYIPGAGQVQDTDLLRLFPLVFVNPFRVHQCKKIGLLRRQIFFMLVSHQYIALPWLPLHLSAPVRPGKRLRGIAPPGIKPSVKQFPLCLLPVHFPRFL